MNPVPIDPRAPGFVDLQVNGYAGLDFNADAVDIDEVIRVGRRLRDEGVSRILVTLITAPLDVMIRRVRLWSSLIDQVRRQCPSEEAAIFAGLHIEGPFISPRPGYVGAHPVDAVRPATIAAAGEILDAGEGKIRLLTLAPEQDSDAAVTRWLTDQNVIVAAGHCDASDDQLRKAIDAGLRLFTHLGNGCPAELPRHDNIIQRVLALSDRLSVSFIADGHHIPVFALKHYLRLMPTENIIIVTDAISAAGLGPGRYPLGDQFVEVDEAGAAWAADRTHFAGSAATMPAMKRILAEKLNIDDTSLDAWMCQNPMSLLQS